MNDKPAVRTPTGRKLLRVASVVLIFAALGPPIGGVVLIMMIAALKMGVSADLAIIALFSLIYGIAFAYLFGVLPASIAGLVIGVWQAFFGRVNWLMALGLGSLIGVGFAFFIGHSRPPDSDAEFPELFFILILSCVLPTMVCWLIVRSWTSRVSLVPTGKLPT